MKFKAAIFDLDGTLLDTIGDLHTTMNNVLTNFNYPVLTREEVRKYIGNGARDFVRCSLPEHVRDEGNVDACLEAYYIEYNKQYSMATKFEGIDELLLNLKAAGYKLAVLSNKPHKSTVKVMETFFPDAGFDIIMGHMEDKFLPKPDTQSIQYILRQFNLPADRAVYIGDGDADAIVSIKAGLYPASVLWGYCTQEELTQVGARHFFESVAQLSDFLLSK